MSRHGRHFVRQLHRFPWGFRSLALIVSATTVSLGMAICAAAPASAAGTPSQLLFSVQPGDGSPGSTLATEPEVTIEDSSNNPVADNSNITLTLTGPGGVAQTGFPATLSCTDNTEAASGATATFDSCAIDRGGLFTLTATDSADGIVGVSQQIFVSGPAQLAFTGEPSGGTAAQSWSGQPQVTLEDANGVPITGSSAQISLAIQPGTGTVGALLGCTSQTATVGSTTGIATFSGCSVNETGTSYALVATDATDYLEGTSDPFDIGAGSASQLVFSAEPIGGAGGAPLSLQPVVEVEDAGGNVIPGNSDQVSLAITDGTGTSGAALACSQNLVTALNGVAKFSGCSINDAGTGYTLTASDSASSLSVVSNPLSITVGAASELAFQTSPSGGAGGAPFGTQPVVTLTDSGDNAATGVVRLSIEPGTGTAGATIQCDLNPLSITGEASFSGCSVNEVGNGYVLEATSGALTAFSSPFSVSQGAASGASFVYGPGNGTGGTALSSQPEVELTDSGGNPAAGDVALSLTTGLGAPGALLSCAQNPVATVDGVAKFSGCAVNDAGTGYSLTATSGTATAQSNSFNVTVGAPAQLAFTTEPVGGTGGTAWATQPTVVVEDAGGNQVTSDDGSISLSVTPGTGTGSLTCTADPLPAVLGSANFTGCSINKKGAAYTLTATDTADGLVGASTPFAITTGLAAQLLFLTQPGGSTAGAVWPAQPLVAVADAGGNPVLTATATVVLSLTAGTGAPGAVLSCASKSEPVSSGTAAFSACSINRAAGGFTLTASDSTDGLHMESQPFSVLLTPPGPLGVAPTGVPLAQTFAGKMYGANPTNVVDDVNTGSGALELSFTDLKVAGIGEPLDVQRSYNSADTTGGSFGPGWSSIFDLGVQISANHTTATVRGEDGQQIVFTWNPFAGWVAPPGAKATLTCLLSLCTVTRFDGVSWQTNGAHIVDYLAPDGQGLRFSYSAGLVAVTVETTGKSPLVVDAHLNSSGQITQITTPTRSTSYGYTGGLLTSFTDADGKTWTYGYSAGRLIAETDPLGQTRLVVTYNVTTGRVASEEKEGSAQHTDDTFSWNPTTQTTTRAELTEVNGALSWEDYTDQYINNVLVGQTFPSGAVIRYSYDSHVNLTEVQDPLGWVQTLGYDPGNDLVLEATPISSTSAAVVSMTYNGLHEMTSQTDPDGNTTFYSYSGGQLVHVQPSGPTSGTSYFYNGAGELVQAITPIGQQLFSYDSAGNRTGVILESLGGQHLNGLGTLASYDEAGDMVTSVDPRGNLSSGVNTAYETTWSYDADGNLVSETTPGPQTTTYTYDAADDLTKAQTPDGTVSTYAWAEATLTSTTVTGGATSTSVYDPSGDLLSQTSGTDQTTAYAYNPDGSEASTTGPDDVTVRYTYDIEGNAIAAMDSAGNVVTREYDAVSRPIRTVNNGQVTLTSYDPVGNVTSTTDPDGAVTTSSYNSLGKVASVSTPAGTTYYGYDPVGDLVSVSDPNGHTATYTYNGAAEKTSSSVNGATTTYAYDIAGNLDGVTDPDGRQTSYTLNGQNLPTKTVYTWSGHTTETVTEQYNALGERSQMVDPNGTVHNFSYDSSGDLLSASSGSNVFTYSYSTPGEIVETYPDGTRVTYGLDDAGNLMSVQVGTQGSPGYAGVSYIRNADRETTGAAFSNGVLETDQLDASGDVLNQTLQLAGTTLASDSFTYDAAGNRLTQTDSVDGTTTSNTYGYDSDERLTSFSSSSSPDPAIPALVQAGLSSPASTVASASEVASVPTGSLAPGTVGGTGAAGAAPALASSARVATGGQLSTTGASSLASSVTGSAAPEQPGAPSGADLPSGAPLFTGSQAALSQVATSPTSTVASAALGGSAQASSAASDPSYAYDGDGNQTSYVTSAGTTKYTYNSADEVASEKGPSGTTTWSYDANGDVTKIVGPSSSQSFTYDAADHLVGVTTTNSGGTTTVSYTYDGDGNRVSETVGSTVTQFIWDPFGQYPQLALEETGSGALIDRFIYGDGPVAMQTPTATYFYHLDPLGSVSEMTNSSGAVVAAYHYDGYGNVTTVGTSPPVNPLLFQGQYLDQSTGLYYMRARNYDPTTGRFTQRDPVGPTAGSPFVSPYVFAADRPAYLTDPTGDAPVTATTLFLSHSTVAANASQDTKDGVTLLSVGIKVGSKLGGYSAAVDEVSLASKVGIEVEPATAALAGTGEAVAVAGKFLSVVGIALQTAVTVEDCLNGPVQNCVGDVVGEAINIGFTIGCSVLTAGAGAVACGLVGAALGIGLQYVISHFGPQIVAGLISLADATAQGVDQVAQEIGQGLAQAGNAIVGVAQAVGGAIATGFNEATEAISSGLQSALTTLENAGYTAVQLAGVLANTFKEGIDQAVASLVNLGYQVEGIVQALASVFSATALQVAQVLKNAFNYAATAVAQALETVFSLGEEAVATVLQAVNYAVDQVASALETAFSDTAKGVATVLNEIGYGVEQIGAALQQVFSELDKDVASILQGLDYGVDQIASALQTLYNDADQAVAAALQFAGFLATAIATALQDVFSDAAQVVAGILKGLSFVANDVATALKDVYNLIDQATAQILSDIGFAVNDIATALSDVFGDLVNQAATVLMDIGVAVNDIATALMDVFTLADQAAATVLKGIGIGVTAIATALGEVFGDIDAVAGQILDNIGFAVDDIATALSQAFGDPVKAVAQILYGIFNDVDQVATALSQVFGEAAQAAAQILEEIGLTATQIATALEDVFNEVANAVGQILSAIGEAVSDIASALETVFNEAATAVADLLQGLGYAVSVIESIGGAFASFGEAVANCFTSFFTDC